MLNCWNVRMSPEFIKKLVSKLKNKMLFFTYIVKVYFWYQITGPFRSLELKLISINNVPPYFEELREKYLWSFGGAMNSLIPECTQTFFDCNCYHSFWIIFITLFNLRIYYNKYVEDFFFQKGSGNWSSSPCGCRPFSGSSKTWLKCRESLDQSFNLIPYMA